MDLNLHESILLLGLDDEKGHFRTSRSYLNYGYAAGIMVDLILAERIAVEEKRLKVKTNALTNNKLLNEELARLQKAKKPPKVTNWLHGMTQRNNKIFKKGIDKLINQRILRLEKKKVLWIFTINRYPSVNLEPENSLRRRLEQIVLKGETPTLEERMLLAIIDACHLIKEIVPDKRLRKQVKERIKVLTADSEVKKLLGNAIQEMQVAIMAATGASI